MKAQNKIIILILFSLLYFLPFGKKVFAISNYNYSQIVWARPGYGEQNGIKLIYGGLVTETEIFGKKCIATNVKKGNNFISFDIDDSFIFNGNLNDAILIVEYFDIGNDVFAIQYDSTYHWPSSGAFVRAGRVIKKQNTKRWKTYMTRVRNVRFANRQGYGPMSSALLNKGGGDFRINSRGDGDEYISYVAVKIPYITVVVNKVGNIFSHKENIIIPVNINNRENSILSSILKYRVLDLDENVILSKQEKINVPKKSIFPYGLEAKVNQKGVFNVFISLHRDNKMLEEYETSFAVCDEPVHKGSFQSPFGVRTLLLNGEIDRTVRILRRLNIGWIRHVFSPEHIDMHKDKLNWERCDTIVNRCYENNINIFGTFLGDATIDPTTGSEEAINDFSKFVSKVVNRYHGKIKYWEIWNEPDLWGFWPSGPSPKNYTRLLKTCYVVIKRIDPTSKVLIGGLGGGLRNRFWFLGHIYENEGGNYFDLVAIHPYTAPDSPEKNDALEHKLNDVSDRLSGKGQINKKICITEIGWPTGRGKEKKDVGIKDQANFLVRSYTIALSHPNVDKILWHCFGNYGLDPLFSHQNYGLVNNDFTPKPAAIAYLNMINQIGNLRYVGRLDLKYPLRGYVFGNGDKKIKILWAIKGMKTLNLPIKGEFVSVTDIMGNTNQLQVKKGELILSLTESPIFLEER